MMTRSDRNAFLIEDRADVMWMNLIDDERQHTCLLTGRADDPDTFDR